LTLRLQKTQNVRSMQLANIDLTDLDRFTAGFPHETFAGLRREAPVWFHRPTPHTPDGEGFWVLSRYADITSAAADAETFSSATGGTRDGGGTIIEDLPLGFAAGVLLNMMDDPRHRRIRKLVTPSVSPRAIAAMEAELRQRTTAILDAVAERGTCDFLVEVAAELPLQAIARLLGVPQEDRHRLFAWANATLDYDDRDLGAQSEKTLAASAAMFEYGGRLIDEKRRLPADDILSAVAHGVVEGADGQPGPLTDIELQMFFNLLIAAGSETTRNSIAAGLLALIQHPDQWRALQTDRSLLPTAIEEFLRWASSTPYNRRTATHDVVVGDETIRAGDKVTLWWASANRDEAVFVDPFRFDIRRDPNPHLAFGYGSHFCLGANLARREMHLVFAALLERFDSIALAGPVEWTRSNKHTGIRHMPVTLHRR
jgi:cytochrome P450